MFPKLFKESKVTKEILVNSGEFIDSLNLSEPKEKFIGYEKYLQLIDGINKLNNSKIEIHNYIKEAFCSSFGCSLDSNEYKNVLRSLELKKRIFGETTLQNGKKSILSFTIASLIKRWMELQDNYLIPTFKNTMCYSSDIIDNINNSLTSQELKFAEMLLKDFYKDYLKGAITGLSIDEITKKEFGLYYTSSIPFGKYSYVQIGKDMLWSSDIYEDDSDYMFDDDADTDEIEDEIELIEDSVEEKINNSWGNSLNELGFRNYEFYNGSEDYKVIKYPIMNTNIFESINKFTHELEVFKNLLQPKKDFLIIFDNEEILRAIKKYHGRRKFRYLINLIKHAYIYGTDFIPAHSF